MKRPTTGICSFGMLAMAMTHVGLNQGAAFAEESANCTNAPPSCSGPGVSLTEDAESKRYAAALDVAGKAAAAKRARVPKGPFAGW